MKLFPLLLLQEKVFAVSPGNKKSTVRVAVDREYLSFWKFEIIIRLGYFAY